jgi:hypothetical protein
LVIAPVKTSTKYTHLELGEEVAAGIAGYYIPQREVRLPHNGREVLYVIGQAVVESSCCGTGSWIYAVVPGYIVDWQHTKNETGLAVSEVEPIKDDEAQGDIRRIIETNDNATMVGFW